MLAETFLGRFLAALSRDTEAARQAWPGRASALIGALARSTPAVDTRHDGPISPAQIPIISNDKAAPRRIRTSRDLHKALGRGATLRGADLHGADLEGADLRGADLEGADLRGADLEGADLREATLDKADLDGATLHGATLRGANLGGAILRGAILRGADLGGASIGGADLEEADLSGATLHEANLHGADLRRARWPEETKWPASVEVSIRTQSEEVGLGVFRVRGGTERARGSRHTS